MAENFLSYCRWMCFDENTSEQDTQIALSPREGHTLQRNVAYMMDEPPPPPPPIDSRTAESSSREHRSFLDLPTFVFRVLFVKVGKRK